MKAVGIYCVICGALLLLCLFAKKATIEDLAMFCVLVGTVLLIIKAAKGEL